MPKNKRSFFERLTGATNIDDYEEETETRERVQPRMEREPVRGRKIVPNQNTATAWVEEEPEEGQLTVDLFQTPSELIIKTMIPGVHPEDLDISITRDMVTIRGTREESNEIVEADYFQRELYWGSFSRTVLLPQEIDVENAEAIEKHGMLTIKMPKLDKSRETKLKVKSS